MASGNLRVVDVPDPTMDKVGHVADWVEICGLHGEAGIVSRTEVFDAMRDAGVIAADDFTVAERDEPWGSAVDLTVEDAGSQLVETLWAELRNRKLLLRDRYPFVVESELLIRAVPTWRDALSLTTLLLVAITARYAPKYIIPTVDGHDFRVLFEKVVEASERGLLLGSTVRFGWPRELSWPANVYKRIDLMADRLGVRVEDLSGKVYPADNDLSLDVASRLSFGDDGPGSVIFLTQCATGKHWTRKRAEPVLEELEDILLWDSSLLRAVAVPWWFESPMEYRRQFRHFGKAVMLDRPRLLAGDPDRYLDTSYEPFIRKWCELQLAALPSL